MENKKLSNFMAKLLDLDPLPHPTVKYKFAPMFPFKQKKIARKLFSKFGGLHLFIQISTHDYIFPRIFYISEIFSGEDVSDLSARKQSDN